MKNKEEIQAQLKAMRERLDGITQNLRSASDTLKEEVKDFASPILLEKPTPGPTVRLTPQEYSQLEKMPDELRPQWLAWIRWNKSHSPASMTRRELFFAGYESAVKYHK